MEEIQISNFQNDVHNIINSVINSHKPVLISDKGHNLVKIVPLAHPKQNSWLGCMKTTGKITGDIVSPVEDVSSWKVFSE
jgi:prevent-host-death family protein